MGPGVLVSGRALARRASRHRSRAELARPTRPPTSRLEARKWNGEAKNRRGIVHAGQLGAGKATLPGRSAQSMPTPAMARDVSRMTATPRVTPKVVPRRRDRRRQSSSGPVASSSRTTTTPSITAATRARNAPRAASSESLDTLKAASVSPLADRIANSSGAAAAPPSNRGRTRTGTMARGSEYSPLWSPGPARARGACSTSVPTRWAALLGSLSG